MKRFLLIIGILWIPQTALAARVFFEPAEVAVTVGSQAVVDVYVDTEGEAINAADIHIVYPPLVTIRSVTRAGSIFSLWVQEPAFGREGIFLSGGVPGGVKTSRGRIARVIFQGNAIGAGSMNLSAPSVVLRNDGQGSAVTLTSGRAMISVAVQPKNQSPSPSATPEKIDHRRPLSFSVAVGTDPGVFDGKRFSSFYTTDPDSGVDHYELSENGGPFRVARSPFLLSSQEGRTIVRVRAYDAAGNWRQAIWPGMFTRLWWWISRLLRID
jgi:hypothetical protein